jgi:hypothetical protein
MTQIKFTDRANIGQVKRTQEGYLSAIARSLRTGIQEYHASELGLMGDNIVRVMRPDESVFSKDSLASAVHIPVTLGHPPELVTADNWKDYAIGEVGSDVMRDGENIAFSLMVKDKDGLAAYESGTREISMGYVADMRPAPDGADYDFIMGPPKYNHLAIVDNARAGSQARIGDTAIKWGAAPLTTKGPEMEMKTIVVGDKAVQIAASDADIVTKLIADMAELRTELASVKIECADATRKIKTDDEIAAMVSAGVKELAEVVDKARKLVADYDATGKDAMTVRREVIAKVYGDEASADLTTDAEIKAAFKVAQSRAAADPVLDAMGKEKPKNPGADVWDKAIENTYGKDKK